MLRTISCFIPSIVCLGWFVVFALKYKHADSAKKVLTFFLANCSILYFCHALYFTFGSSLPQECLWTLCSMSAYPIYYIYICHISSARPALSTILLILLPGIIVASAKYFFPGEETDNIRKLVFALQVFGLCYFGSRKLQNYDKELAELYADTEGRDATAVKHLLYALVTTSVFSTVANAIGKDYFARSEWGILIVIVPFSVMLFLLSYIGFNRKFTVEQFIIDSDMADMASATIELSANSNNTTNTLDRKEIQSFEIENKLEILMREKQFFLTPNLKLGDVVKEVGICRTYISNHINKTYGCSFSDYINKLRIEHAKVLMAQTDNAKLATISQMAGFTSEQSFYRNFHKFTGMKPLEWMNMNKERSKK